MDFSFIFLNLWGTATRRRREGGSMNVHEDEEMPFHGAKAVRTVIMLAPQRSSPCHTLSLPVHT